MPDDLLNGAASWFFRLGWGVLLFGVGLLLAGVVVLIVLIVLVARRVRLGRRRRAVQQATIRARRAVYIQGRAGLTASAPSFRADETAVMHRAPEVWPTDPGRTAVIPRQREVGRG